MAYTIFSFCLFSHVIAEWTRCLDRSWSQSGLVWCWVLCWVPQSASPHPPCCVLWETNLWASQAAPVLQDLAWYNWLGLGVLLNTKLAQNLNNSQDHWKCRLLGPPWHLASAHISEPSSPWGKVQSDKLLKRKAAYRTLELQMFALDCLLSEHDTKGRGPPPTPLQAPGHGATRHLEGTGTFVKVSRRAIGETAFQHMIGNGSSVKHRRPRRDGWSMGAEGMPPGDTQMQTGGFAGSQGLELCRRAEPEESGLTIIVTLLVSMGWWGLEEPCIRIFEHQGN